MYEAVYQFIDNYSYLVEALWITDPVGRSFLPRENTVIFLHSFSVDQRLTNPERLNDFA